MFTNGKSFHISDKKKKNADLLGPKYIIKIKTKF